MKSKYYLVGAISYFASLVTAAALPPATLLVVRIRFTDVEDRLGSRGDVHSPFPLLPPPYLSPLPLVVSVRGGSGRFAARRG